MNPALRVDDDPRGFRTVLMDRPHKLNAVDEALIEGLHSALNEAPGPVVVLGSSESRAFSSGADLDVPDSARAHVSERLYELYEAMRETSKIIIAAASGHAVGAGAQLLIASDLRVGSPDLRIRFMGVGHGLVVGAWGLPSLVGRGRALDLCLSMRSVPAEEALSIGLIDRLAVEPISAAQNYAAEVCELDLRAVADAKQILSLADQRQALLRERQRNSGWDGSAQDTRTTE